MTLLRWPADPTSAASSLGYQIRPATVTDIPELAQLLAHSFYGPQQCHQWWFPWLRSGIQEDLKMRFRPQGSLYRCWAATLISTEGESQIIGTIELSVKPLSWLTVYQRVPYVANLAVHANYRRRGVAQTLLKACETQAREWGFRQLYLHVSPQNASAGRLYRQMGYQAGPVRWQDCCRFNPRQLLQKSF